MTTATQPETHKPRLTERINFRILIFSGVVLFLLGTPIYIYLKESLTGGIEQVGDYTKVNLKAMGNFVFDQNDGTLDDVPQKYRELDGRKVLLEGEIWAPNEAGATMSQFELVYSISKCCFGGPPKVQERVYAKVPVNMEVPNLTWHYARVLGTLHVDVKKEAGQITSVYTMTVEDIRPL
jgi:hypothetical protein